MKAFAWINIIWLTILFLDSFVFKPLPQLRTFKVIENDRYRSPNNRLLGSYCHSWTLFTEEGDQYHLTESTDLKFKLGDTMIINKTNLFSRNHSIYNPKHHINYKIGVQSDHLEFNNYLLLLSFLISIYFLLRSKHIDKEDYIAVFTFAIAITVIISIVSFTE